MYIKFITIAAFIFITGKAAEVNNNNRLPSQITLDEKNAKIAIHEEDPVQSDFSAIQMMQTSEEDEEEEEHDISFINKEDNKTPPRANLLSTFEHSISVADNGEYVAIPLSPQEPSKDLTVDTSSRFNLPTKEFLTMWYNSTQINNSDNFVQSDFSLSNLGEISELLSELPPRPFTKPQLEDSKKTETQTHDKETGIQSNQTENSLEKASSSASNNSSVDNEPITIVLANTSTTQTTENPESGRITTEVEPTVTVTPINQQNIEVSTNEEQVAIVTPSSTGESEQKFFFPPGMSFMGMNSNNMFGHFPSMMGGFFPPGTSNNFNGNAQNNFNGNNLFNNQNPSGGSSSSSMSFSSSSVNGQKPMTVMTGSSSVNGQMQTSFTSMTNGDGNSEMNQFGSIFGSGFFSNNKINGTDGSVSSQMSISSSSVNGEKPITVMTGSNSVNGQIQNQFASVNGEQISMSNQNNGTLTEQRISELSEQDLTTTTNLTNPLPQNDINESSVSPEISVSSSTIIVTTTPKSSPVKDQGKKRVCPCRHRHKKKPNSSVTMITQPLSETGNIQKEPETLTSQSLSITPADISQDNNSELPSGDLVSPQITVLDSSVVEDQSETKTTDNGFVSGQVEEQANLTEEQVSLADITDTNQSSLDENSSKEEQETIGTIQDQLSNIAEQQLSTSDITDTNQSSLSGNNDREESTTLINQPVSTTEEQLPTETSLSSLDENDEEHLSDKGQIQSQVVQLTLTENNDKQEISTEYLSLSGTTATSSLTSFANGPDAPTTEGSQTVTTAKTKEDTTETIFDKFFEPTNKKTDPSTTQSNYVTNPTVIEDIPPSGDGNLNSNDNPIDNDVSASKGTSINTKEDKMENQSNFDSSITGESTLLTNQQGLPNASPQIVNWSNRHKYQIKVVITKDPLTGQIIKNKFEISQSNPKEIKKTQTVIDDSYSSINHQRPDNFFHHPFFGHNHHHFAGANSYFPERQKVDPYSSFPSFPPHRKCGRKAFSKSRRRMGIRPLEHHHNQQHSFEASTSVTSDPLGHVTVTSRNPSVGEVISTTYGAALSDDVPNADILQNFYHKYYFPRAFGNEGRFFHLNHNPYYRVQSPYIHDPSGIGF